MFLPKHLALAVSGLFALPSVLAAQPVQKVKPPVSQAYIDLATFSGGMQMPGGAGGLMGAMFGAKASDNTFGMTQAQSPGRWMDVTLLTRNNSKLTTATQSVPAGAKLGPVLNLLAPDQGPADVPAYDDTDPEPTKFEMPKGKMYLYWGCGAEVRKGQPLVLDLAKMDPKQFGKFFQNRSATSRVPQPAPGRPGWPNKNDTRRLPDGASLVGEHGFAGAGVVDGFKFNIDAQHDLMPAVEASRDEDDKAVLFKWKPMRQASGWFVQSMGMRDAGKGEAGEMEMVYWTSSELPDMGMGLVNYQPNGSISKWQKEKVLLPAGATECMAPKEAVGPMAMSRVIAYGEELNMAYPPRPKDPKVTWEPQWNVKVRLKSVASLMPGMGAAMQAAMVEQEGAPEEKKTQAPAKAGVTEAVTKGVVDVLTRGLFGR
ncbi:hypothetical protein [Massilia sp. BSC265]|uniref:hypothetical protein n=1 Tax=Massilia sp. BSC265 TaxID=1549812 RepID=UPI0004E8E38D|nr:hypothetical protein [Massilia sp. BSC265]KFI08861.1 hypothetical protein JN27_01535 [Massilia sp. BSC265]